MKRTWKTGELAAQIGVTNRTLRHYHQIGLLLPSRLSEAGHRIYTEEDIARLQQILSLKQMGLSLEDIKQFIDSPAYNPVEIIKSQLEILEDQIHQKQVLLRKLQELYEVMQTNQILDTSELLVIMAILQKDEQNHLSPEQINKLKTIGNRVGSQRQTEMRLQWDKFLESLRQHTENNIPVSEDSAKALAVFWNEMIIQMTENDTDLIKATERFHSTNANNPLSFGLTPEMYKYLQNAIKQVES